MFDQLRQIALFAKTVDHGSFRGAARELGLSPSVVSHHISQLEEHLGVALLYRSTRKLAVTREGEQLLAAAYPMIETVEGVLSQLSNSSGAPSGELRLTTPSVLIQSPLTDLLASFSMKYPDIKLVLDYSDVRQDIISEGYDVALRMGVDVKNSAVTRNLFQVERRLVASKDYLKGRPKVATPDELLDWDWVQLSQVRHIKPTFRKSGAKSITIKPNAHIISDSALAVYRLARSGVGLAVVLECLAEGDVSSGDVEYVLPNWKLEPINVFATWPANAPKHGLISLLVNEVSPEHLLKK